MLSSLVGRAWSVLEEAWENRAPDCNFRNLRTSGFSTTGSGTTYVCMTEHNGTFLVGLKGRGYRSHYNHPIVQAISEKTNRWSVPPRECMYERGVSPQLFENVPPSAGYYGVWFAVSRDRFSIFNHRDITANNLACSAFGNLPIIYSSGNPIIRGATNWSRFYYGPLSNVHFDVGMHIYKDGTYEPMVNLWDSPKITKYDKGAYNRGWNALKFMYKLMKVYVRHNTVQAHSGWYSWAWDEQVIQAMLNHVALSDTAPSPEEFQGFFRNGKVLDCNIESIRTNYQKFCLISGINRIVEYNHIDKDETLYYPIFKTGPQIDYDRFI